MGDLSGAKAMSAVYTCTIIATQINLQSQL